MGVCTCFRLLLGSLILTYACVCGAQGERREEEDDTGRKKKKKAKEAVPKKAVTKALQYHTPEFIESIAALCQPELSPHVPGLRAQPPLPGQPPAAATGSARQPMSGAASNGAAAAESTAGERQQQPQDPPAAAQTPPPETPPLPAVPSLLVFSPATGESVWRSDSQLLMGTALSDLAEQKIRAALRDVVAGGSGGAADDDEIRPLPVVSGQALALGRRLREMVMAPWNWRTLSSFVRTRLQNIETTAADPTCALPASKSQAQALGPDVLRGLAARSLWCVATARPACSASSYLLHNPTLQTSCSLRR